ncbi:MAG: hypothetical protein EUB_02664 [Eubacterium sp.]|uniref:DUF2922 domain-containing protein n=1 Tax=Eubacterium sp. TaxID=142586 RepID=UPI00304B3EDE
METTTTTTKTLELEFNLTNGDRYTLSLPNYLADLTQEQIETAAATIVAKKLFVPDGANLESLFGFQYVDKTVRKTEV